LRSAPFKIGPYGLLRRSRRVTGLAAAARTTSALPWASSAFARAAPAFTWTTSTFTRSAPAALTATAASFTPPSTAFTTAATTFTAAATSFTGGARGRRLRGLWLRVLCLDMPRQQANRA